jgi:hypothetical protein
VADNSVISIGGNVDGSLQYTASVAGSPEVKTSRSRPIKLEAGSGNRGANRHDSCVHGRAQCLSSHCLACHLVHGACM